MLEHERWSSDLVVIGLGKKELQEQDGFDIVDGIDSLHRCPVFFAVIVVEEVVHFSLQRSMAASCYPCAILQQVYRQRSALPDVINKGSSRPTCVPRANMPILQ